MKKTLLFSALFISTILLLNGETSMNASKPPHHADKGFRNLSPDAQMRNLLDVIRWQTENIFKKLPSRNPKDYSFTVYSNDGYELKKNREQFSATWVGHATVLIQIDGKNILTDPIWSERCSPVGFAGPKRYTAPGIDIDRLPKIDAVVISHNHYDHMDIPTLKVLDKKFSPVIYAGLRNREFLKSEGLKNPVELDWWQSDESAGIKITFTPTQHFSGRGVLDHGETLWGSYVIEGKTKKAYFAGDTAYFSGFAEIGNKFPKIDLAILPIGAYEPRWFMKPVHMNPEESVKTFLDLKADNMLPMHYQTFVLTDEPLDEPLRLTKELFEKNGISLTRLADLKIGESRFWK
ncbi:MAG TPA: MBL fold metallo-hydrolase [Leptospiraceae bacterium]|nr:MBL fold metallo-hydrolase [Leptospiraceae bacterium]HMY68228.1 MBL fold metallo-hydrolase [Leptospiraceae bacterium]HMZ60259.1 MBL fold metallo-hydrolase [Leptospiraceae bacterium]HNF12627.1 MBL fold metallo-hydrolase [Leptospiraceae bacterium]HNF24669.1 MBL fold metallo-hydrolase [Leptospiraceae bacterium]